MGVSWAFVFSGIGFNQSELETSKRNLRAIERQLRIKNNKVKFYYEKLRIIHREFIRYSKSYEKLYQKYCKIDDQNQHENIRNWLLKYQHYKNYIQSNERKLEDYETNINHNIPFNLDDYLEIQMTIGTPFSW